MEKLDLYNGDVIIYFDNVKHKFYREDKSPIKTSVTGFTGIRDKSGPLMWWVAQEMGKYLIDNWIIGKITKESQKAELIDSARKEYRIASQKAADIGTAIHEYIEEWIKGNKPAIPKNEMIVNGITAFHKFQKEHKVKWIASERKIYSVEYDYGGILDGIGIIDGKLYFVDFKSSKGIYDEMVFQVAAYRMAIEEEIKHLLNTKKKIINPLDAEILKAYKKYGGFHSNMIIKFGKYDGEFSFATFDDYKKDLEAFFACRTLKMRTDTLKPTLHEHNNPGKPMWRG